MGIVDIKNSCYEKQLIYPGSKKSYPFICVNNNIHPLVVEDCNIFSAHVIYENAIIALAKLLDKVESDLIGDRVPVIAFGANRNIENILWKLKKYEARDKVVIALPAYIENAESVVSSIFYSGHFYADIIFNMQYSKNTVLEASLLLLSAEQLYALNKSENVPEQDMCNHWGAKIAAINVFVPTMGFKRIKALIYVSETIILKHPEKNQPIAFREIFAFNRKISDYSQRQLYEIFLEKGERFTKQQVENVLSDLNALWIDKDMEKYKTYNYISDLLKKYAWIDVDNNYINGEYLAKRDKLLLEPEEWWNISKDYLLCNNGMFQI